MSDLGFYNTAYAPASDLDPYYAEGTFSESIEQATDEELQTWIKAKGISNRQVSAYNLSGYSFLDIAYELEKMGYCYPN